MKFPDILGHVAFFRLIQSQFKVVLCQPLEPFSMRIVRAALRPRNVRRSSRTESDRVIISIASLLD